MGNDRTDNMRIGANLEMNPPCKDLADANDKYVAPAGYVSDLVDGARFTVQDPDDVAIPVFSRPQIQRLFNIRMRHDAEAAEKQMKKMAEDFHAVMAYEDRLMREPLPEYCVEHGMAHPCEACAVINNYDQVMADHDRLVRELDVLLNGEAGAAKQASLCDLVSQVRREGIHTGTPARLWLWKNFADGKPEYWAFDNAYPAHLDNNDPQTLGEPCGYAIFKPSRQRRKDVSDEQVLRRIAGAKTSQPLRYRWAQDDPDEVAGVMEGPVPEGEWVKWADVKHLFGGA